MIEWLKSKRTFYRYLLSYALIVSFLLLGTLYIVNLQLKSEFHRAHLNQSMDELEIRTENLTERFLDSNRLFIALQRDISLILSRFTNSSGMQIEAVEEMRKYISGNSLIKDVLYIDTLRENIMSTKYYTAYSNDIISIYIDDEKHDFSLEAFAPFDIINRLVRIDSDGRSFFIYSPRQDHINSKALFILDELELAQLLNTLLSQTVRSVALVDGEMNILLETTDGLIKNKLSDMPASPAEIQGFLARENLVAFQIASPEISLLAYSDLNIVKQQISLAFKKSYGVIILIALLGILLTMVAMRITYNPVIATIRKITGGSGSKSDNLEDIISVFDDAATEKIQLQGKITKYQLAIQHSMLDTMLEQNSEAGSESFTKIDNLFEPDKNNCIFIASVVLSHDVSTDDMRAYFAEKLFDVDICLISRETQLSLKMILNDSSHSTIEEKEGVIKALFADFQLRFSCKVAVSDTSSNPLDIARLYNNSEIAAKSLGEQTLVFFQDLKEPLKAQAENEYPYYVLDSISDCLEEHNFESANKALDILFDFVSAEHTPNFFIRCVLIDAASTIAHFMNLSNIKFEKYSAEYLQALYLCRSSDYRCTKQEIRLAMAKMLDVFDSESEARSFSISKVRAYIQGNAFSCEFSTTALADAFGTSTAYMSYLFKKLAGCNITEYVWQLRLARAQELLSETSDSIDQISNMVGYDNTSSFRRKFKESVGCTPSLYRQQNSGDNK